MPGVMRTLGFVGLGRMGVPMAARLAAAGHHVLAYDPRPDAPELAAAAGCRAVASLAEAAEPADAVLVSVPDPAAVEEVFLGAGGVLESCRTGAVAVDLSTSSPALARRLAAAGIERGVAVLDAPVSGGPVRAQDGTLVVMVGGPDEAVRRILPTLELLGEVVHAGAAGCGQATKLCNNLLTGVHMAALAESLALAEREGLDPERLFRVLTGGTADSSVLRRRFPVPGVLPDAPASHGFAAQFAVALMHKDLRLALEAAEDHGLGLPLVREAATRYAEAAASGWDDLDYSVVARVPPSAGGPLR